MVLLLVNRDCTWRGFVLHTHFIGVTPLGFQAQRHLQYTHYMMLLCCSSQTDLHISLFPIGSVFTILYFIELNKTCWFIYSGLVANSNIDDLLKCVCIHFQIIITLRPLILNSEQCKPLRTVLCPMTTMHFSVSRHQDSPWFGLEPTLFLVWAPRGAPRCHTFSDYTWGWGGVGLGMMTFLAH